MQFSFRLLVFMTLFFICLADSSDTQNSTIPESICGGNEKILTLLDISKESISRAKVFYPNYVHYALLKRKEKSLAYLDVASSVISEVKKCYPSCPDPVCPEYVEKPMDCSDILRSGMNESGVYDIWPRSRISNNKPLAVYCDMETDGGGWTVIQRRGNFSSPEDYFYKDWDSYKRGFGNITEDFWIGNDNIHAISNQASYQIRFDLKNATNSGFTKYETFWIESEEASYTLHIKGYKGNAGHAMYGLDGKKFSTKDRNNGNGGIRLCVKVTQGAWWYDEIFCTLANLNGPYKPGIDSYNASYWITSENNFKGLSEVEIKLRS